MKVPLLLGLVVLTAGCVEAVEPPKVTRPDPSSPAAMPPHVRARVESFQADRARRQEETARREQEQRARQEAETRRLRAQEAERAAAQAGERTRDQAFGAFMDEQRRLGRQEGWWSPWMAGGCAPAREPEAWARVLHRVNSDPSLTRDVRRVRTWVHDRGPIVRRDGTERAQWAVILMEDQDRPGARRAWVLSTDVHFCNAQMARERLGMPPDVPGGESLPRVW